MDDSIEPEIYDDDFSFYNMNSIIEFVKNNLTQIFLFLLVFIIIYIVDHISNFNAMLMAIEQQQLAVQHKKNLKNKSKK
jgi:hypothetical protein